MHKFIFFQSTIQKKFYKNSKKTKHKDPRIQSIVSDKSPLAYIPGGEAYNTPTVSSREEQDNPPNWCLDMRFICIR